MRHGRTWDTEDWLLGGRVTLNERKKTNGWRLPRGQYYRMIEYALGYWESINSTLRSCSRLKNKVFALFGNNFYGITLRLLVSTLVRLEVWFHGWSSLLRAPCSLTCYITIFIFTYCYKECGWNSCRNRYLSGSSIPFSRQSPWPSSN